MNMQFDKVNEFIDNFIKEIEKLRECTNRFANTKEHLAGWTGGAKDVFEQNIEKSMPAFDELVSVVNSYAVVASNAHEQYASAESALINQMMG